jgi:hypothetical protein
MAGNVRWEPAEGPGTRDSLSAGANISPGASLRSPPCSGSRPSLLFSGCGWTRSSESALLFVGGHYDLRTGLVEIIA